MSLWKNYLQYTNIQCSMISGSDIIGPRYHGTLDGILDENAARSWSGFCALQFPPPTSALAVAPFHTIDEDAGVKKSTAKRRLLDQIIHMKRHRDRHSGQTWPAFLRSRCHHIDEEAETRGSDEDNGFILSRM